MANLNVNNYNNLKLMLNKDEYWDFFVNKDACVCNVGINYDEFDREHLLTYIDLCDDECSDEWIYGKEGYSWKDSIAVEHTMYDITYCGVDNGLFLYRKDRITNKEFVDIFSKNNYHILQNDYRLKLHAVSGTTLLYEYPLHKEDCCVKLNGGFYQGFFKTECDKYQILPTNFEDGDVYDFEFTLKKCDLEKESDKTLNDKYPNNKGIFFFLGTRAENKWIYLYDKEDANGLEACFELGVDDFVEDGEIDKNTYIIGNFNGEMIEFDGYDPFELGDYTDYKYYDDETPRPTANDIEDLSFYLDMPTEGENTTVDEENKEYKVLTWCCENSDNDDNTVLMPYFVGCGCPKRYKRVKKDGEVDNTIMACQEFGDSYIGDWDDLEDFDVSRDYVESELDITDFDYSTSNEFKLSEGNQYYFKTDNKFLIFNRTKTGKTVSDWEEGTEFMFQGRKDKFKGNLFILMNRTKTGYTVNTIDALRNRTANEYDPYKDIYNNALAFRITDDGEIGYRLITIDCEKEGNDKTLVLEGYSNKGVIPNCEWFTVDVKTIFLGGNKMKFMFYINGKLIFITKELPRINLRYLDDLKEKQEGVPFNISIGGGSQGLCETVLYNYMLNPTRVYPIEENFAGSFIGYLKTFKMYDNVVGRELFEINYKKEIKN